MFGHAGEGIEELGIEAVGRYFHASSSTIKERIAELTAHKEIGIAKSGTKHQGNLQAYVGVSITPIGDVINKGEDVAVEVHGTGQLDVGIGRAERGLPELQAGTYIKEEMVSLQGVVNAECRFSSGAIGSNALRRHEERMLPTRQPQAGHVDRLSGKGN